MITACCFLFLFSNVGLPSTSFSVYQPYIVALPGVGDIGGSIVLAIRSIVSLLGLLVVARFVRLVNIRCAVAIGCVLNAIGFFSYSFADGMPAMIIGAIFTGAGYGLGGMVCMTVVLRRWFKHDVGTAVGIASVGTGVAGVIVPIISLQLIHGISLSASFLVEALISLVIGLLVFIVLKNSPEDLDIQSRPSDTPATSTAQTSTQHNNEKTIPKSTCHALYGSMFLFGMMAFGGMSYLSILMTSEGFDHIFAGTMLSLAGFFLIIRKVTVGKTFDRIGSKKGSALFFAILILGLIGCCLIPLHNMAEAITTTILYGLGSSLASVGTSIWSIELSNPEDLLKNIKNYQVFYAAGGVLFNMLPGILKELTGTYAISYAVFCLKKKKESLSVRDAYNR